MLATRKVAKAAFFLSSFLDDNFVVGLPLKAEIRAVHNFAKETIRFVVHTLLIKGGDFGARIAEDRAHFFNELFDLLFLFFCDFELLLLVLKYF